MNSHDQNAAPASGGRIFDWTAAAVNVLTGAVLVGLVLLVCTEVFKRSILGGSLGFAEEVSAYMVVALTLFGAALALRSGSLFRVEFLFKRLGPKMQHVVTLFFIVLSLACCLLLVWKCYGLVGSSFTRGRFAATVLRTPLWIPQSLLPAGFAIIALFLIEQAIVLLRPAQEAR